MNSRAMKKTPSVPPQTTSPPATAGDQLHARVMIRDVRTVLITPPPPTSVKPPDTAVLAHILSATYDLATETQENLVAAYLDSRGRLIATERLYRGTVDHAMVSTADVIRTALLLNANGIVVAHNHPSGDPTPSDDDIAFTRELKLAVELLHMRLLDHIIIAGSEYSSMAGAGYLSLAVGR